MDRKKLGKLLCEMRNGSEVSLTTYVVKSIEEGRSSYSVSNLFQYADSIGCGILVWDYTLDEHYRVGNPDECHQVIEMLVEQNGMNFNTLSTKTGIRYTRSSLSIDTFLAILSYFYCTIRLYRTAQPPALP